MALWVSVPFLLPLHLMPTILTIALAGRTYRVSFWKIVGRVGVGSFVCWFLEERYCAGVAW